MKELVDIAKATPQDQTNIKYSDKVEEQQGLIKVRRKHNRHLSKDLKKRIHVTQDIHEEV